MVSQHKTRHSLPFFPHSIAGPAERFNKGKEQVQLRDFDFITFFSPRWTAVLRPALPLFDVRQLRHVRHCGSHAMRHVADEHWRQGAETPEGPSSSVEPAECFEVCVFAGQKTSLHVTRG